MSKATILLICIILCSKETFLQVNCSTISYEQIRELLDKLNSVAKVRTTAELQTKGNELATLDFIGLVQQYDGYQAEEYDVETEDGYILKLHRINRSPRSPKTTDKPVVYLQHGIYCTSEFFVISGPYHGLAYLLADAGFDVWLGNARGTTYSKRHVKYSPASTNYDFWKFNVDDVGLKDTPAFIDAVLANTNRTKLTYIGHSMGTTMSYILLSSKPEYNDKIDISISLAPVAYFIKPHTLFLKSWLVLRALIGVFSQNISGGFIGIIRTGYEHIRESIHKLDNVKRVRTTAELQEEGNKYATLDFIGLVQHKGYGAEEYDVETEDGYILKLHRIISSPRSPKAGNKPVVFMQHGLLGSSDIFVNLGPTRDLAYLLADEGYDIWLGNVRGNYYSRRNVKYSPESTNYDFWQFSIDDHALKDAPVMIDTALKKTNKTKLTYIGHSMGTSINMMLLSSKPEYNNKINLSVNLAPIVYFLRPYRWFVNLILSLRILIPLCRIFKIYEMIPLSIITIFISKTICPNAIGVYLCNVILGSFLNIHNVNHNDKSSILSVIFNGASLDVLTHFSQLLNKEKFIKFDYGPDLNQEKYNSTEPPEYDLSKIAVPQALYYAEDDVFVLPKAERKVKRHLKNVVAFEKTPESYNHYDLVWAKTARTDYFYKLVKLIKRFAK